MDTTIVDQVTREHIDNLRKSLENLKCKDPNDQDILLSRDEKSKLATICIKSGGRNALSGRMISKLTEILDELYNWPEGKGLLIKGDGGRFCSGSDLVCARETASQESGLKLAQIMQFNIMRIQRLPMVSLTLIEGYALGGGAELALASDLRLISASAEIGFVHVKNGVCCGWGGGARLVELVGPTRAIDILSSGRKIKSEEAVRIGLANEVIYDAEISMTDQALEYLALRTVGSSNIIKKLKCMVNSARLLPINEALRLEAELFASTWGKEEQMSILNLRHNVGGSHPPPTSSSIDHKSLTVTFHDKRLG